jgi:hypothetical protein
MCNQFRLETQNQARTWLILDIFRTRTCAYLNTLHKHVYFRALADTIRALGVKSKRRLFGTATKQMLKNFTSCDAEVPAN